VHHRDGHTSCQTPARPLVGGRRGLKGRIAESSNCHAAMPESASSSWAWRDGGQPNRPQMPRGRRLGPFLPFMNLLPWDFRLPLEEPHDAAEAQFFS
jgi:hypothetical protein